MEIKFEEVISSFLEKRVGISHQFLSADLALQLKLNLIQHCDNEKLRLAGIGNKHLLNHDQDIRRDKIFWLDKNSVNLHEQEFFHFMDDFVLYLNSTCFTSINSYEFHYALYEKGAFYKRHLDQFRFDDSRVFSIIMYLNEGWIDTDGGALKIYNDIDFEIIAPTNQKCVFFKSNELEHEVLLSNVDRMSITGWLKTSI